MRHEKILEQYKKIFSTEVTEEEIDILIKNNCECCRCSTSLFEMDDFPEIHNGYVYCEDCYKEEFMDTCPICEEYFTKATCPEEEKIIVTKWASRELGLEKAGFYQVKEYPYTFGDILSGVHSLFNDSLELIRECDINSMLTKIYEREMEIISSECCHQCVNKYTGKTKLENNYTDEEYGEKFIAIQNEVIKNGF